MEPLTLGALAGFGIAIPVGAISVLIVETGIRCGFSCAVSAGAGAATADLLYAVLGVTGGATLAAFIASIQQPLRWVSAIVLGAMAVSGLRRVRAQPRAHMDVRSAHGSHAVTYARFLGLTIVNPLTVVYFATVLLGTGLAADLTVTQATTFALGVFLASLSWQTLLAATGGISRTKLPRRLHIAVSVAGNLVVLAIAALFVVR